MKTGTLRSALMVLMAAVALTAIAAAVNGEMRAHAHGHLAGHEDGGLSLLTPQNTTVLLADYQRHAFARAVSRDEAALRNSVEGLAKAARLFDVPTVISAVATESIEGTVIPEVAAAFPNHPTRSRSSMNAWDDRGVVSEVERWGRQKLVIAGLQAEASLTMPALSALEDGYQVYIVVDASGGASRESFGTAIDRLVQAGAIPVTWQQVMLEWQRDWSDTETADAVMGIAREHSGASPRR